MSDVKMFSKHAIVQAAHRAGAKGISVSGVAKVREVLEQKMRELATRMGLFYTGKHGKTITKKLVWQFLNSEGVRYSTEEAVPYPDGSK